MRLTSFWFRSGNVRRQWEVVAIGQQQDRCAFSLAAHANRGAPFFARENEPSASNTCQSMPPKSSSSCSSRCHARSHIR